MKASSFTAFLLGITGCIGSSRDIDARADAELADLRSATQAAIVMARCEDGRVLGPSCGFLARSLERPEVRARFIDRHCRSLDETACQSRYRTMADAMLADRYYAAEWEAVARGCDAAPSACDTPIELELALMRSHNDRIVDVVRHKDVRIEQARRAAKEALLAAQASTATAFVSEALYLLHPGPKCRAYPSVFEGVVNTICAP